MAVQTTQLATLHHHLSCSAQYKINPILLLPPPHKDTPLPFFHISNQMLPSNPKKRHRHHNPHPHPPSTTNHHPPAAVIDSFPDNTLSESSQKLHRTSSFNDSSTADVILRLFIDQSSPFDHPSDSSSSSSSSSVDESDIHLYLHSHVLRRSKYFSALLSDRWQQNQNQNQNNTNNKQQTDSDISDISGTDSNRFLRIKLGVQPNPNSIATHLSVLELLYTHDLGTAIDNVSTALDILPVALELLFEDCVKSCVKFLEAVPWSEDEEKRVIGLIPFLRDEESKELLARVSPAKIDLCEEMLHGLILAAIHNHSNMAFVKAFVAKLLRDFSSRESARRVLERAFETSLKVVKESLEEYSSPDFRGDHNETEAIQRLNLHTAMTNGRHLLWLVERMIELKVADSAVKEWSEQPGFTADLQRAFRDDAWRNIVPGLPAVVLRCTCKLANAVAAGTILAARQVRMKLVKDWLPVLIVCKDNVSPLLPSHKPLYLELEETFLRIISTLPMSDAQELLQQCLSFSTRNVEDCPHLITAFNTWFRRATRLPQVDNLS